MVDQPCFDDSEWNHGGGSDSPGSPTDEEGLQGGGRAGRQLGLHPVHAREVESNSRYSPAKGVCNIR